MSGTQQEKRNKIDGGSEFTVSSLPKEFEPNELVDAAVDVLHNLIYEQTDNTVPLKVLKWPVMDWSVWILILSPSAKNRMKQFIAFSNDFAGTSALLSWVSISRSG